MKKNVRRIVTRRTRDGTSVVVSDGSPPRVMTVESLPYLEVTDLWATDDIPTLPEEQTDPTVGMWSLLPSLGGTRFRIVRISPADINQFEDKGLHSSDTMEYLVIVSGEVWLQLEDGTEIHLHQGDCVVQHGTRHTWSNRSSTDCLMAAVVVGLNH